MWAIRRASTQFRNKGLLSSSSRILCGKTEFAKGCSEACDAANIASQETMLSCARFYSKSSGIPGEFQSFSSKVGAKSEGEDSDNGFSELETSLDAVEESTSGDENDVGLSSGSELSDDEGYADGAPNEIETDENTKPSAAKVYPTMCKAILSSPAVAVSTVLDKWVEEGIKDYCQVLIEFSGGKQFAKCCSEPCDAANIASQETMLSCARFYSKSSGIPGEFRTFSSKVGAKSEGENSDDGFSEFETPLDAVEGSTSGDENDDGLSSGSELSDDEGNADGAPNEMETDEEKKPSAAKVLPKMCKAILSSHAAVSTVLKELVKEGYEVTRDDAYVTMDVLRRRRLVVKALQLSEWLESNKVVELDETNCASRVDLVAKVQGLFKAENFIKQLPESLRTEKVYRTLLANCVIVKNVKKAEELFDNMKDSGFPLTSFACNQMLLLYKRTERWKIAEILQLMEEKDIIPSVFTYQVLIDVKGQSKKIDEMEELLEKMEAQGLTPTSHMQKSIAEYYVNAGLLDKAEAVLKEIEGDSLEKNRWACRLLIPIYASLERAEEVERIWKTCESDPYVEECLAAIDAWGKLKEIEKAEAAFDKLLKKVKNPSSKFYTALLNIYARNSMLNKGKELVNRMASSGCIMRPLALDALVRLYLGAGEVEMAGSILEKAIQKRTGKPMFNTYMAVMDKYAEIGDVHNTEKVFQMMREGGYIPRIRQYQSLLNAYLTAKKPAYGFRERMKACNVIPSRTLSSQLADMNIFNKSPVCDLLE